MPIISPDEIVKQYGQRPPELLAGIMGYQVTRLTTGPKLRGVRVFSAYEPGGPIILYQEGLKQLAKERGEPFERLEQWHIAHELYHAVAEGAGISPWRVRETEADLWADELMALTRRGKR